MKDEKWREEELSEADEFLSKLLSKSDKEKIRRRLKKAGLWKPGGSWTGRLLCLALLDLWEKENG